MFQTGKFRRVFGLLSKYLLHSSSFVTFGGNGGAGPGGSEGHFRSSKLVNKLKVDPIPQVPL
jgi:hypothetical protein